MRLRRAIAAALSCGLIGLCAAALAGQDRRTVSEPRVPPPCATLTAFLRSRRGDLPASAESRPDTARIQSAINHCPAGRAVVLRPGPVGDAFLSGPLQLRAGVTLLIARGATLFASRDPRAYDVRPGSCGVVNQDGRGCRPLLLAANAPGAAVTGFGAIDGRGGDRPLGERETWWQLARRAQREKAFQNVPRLIVASHSDNFTLYRITLRNSPNFHVIVGPSRGFTAWGVTVDTPAGARNTDGIDLLSCVDASILHCRVHAGDDDVCLKAGAAGPTAHVTVADDHFYTGHGLSIGSETNGGVRDVLVRDVTLDGAVNGLRIKSDARRGGLVRNVIYENVCMRGVRYPILMTPFYEGNTGALVPAFRDITLRGVTALDSGTDGAHPRPGEMQFLGADAAHRLSAALNGVAVEGVPAARIRAAHARLTLGPGPVNFRPAGPDVELTAAAATVPAVQPPSCRNAFPPFRDPTLGDASTAAVSGFSDPAHPAARPNLVVAADGSGDFRSPQAAVDALPASGGTIRIKPGVYREVVTIRKPHVRLIGARDPRAVEIVFGNSAGATGGTLHSATLNVLGDDFQAQGFTVANDYSDHRPLKFAGSQAVALLVTGDRAVFRDLRILGAQDTLYAGARACASEQGPCVPARQYFSRCFIAGNVDFIFGDGVTYFDHCEIHVRPHSEAMLTAQSKRYPGEDSLYVFNHCKVTADPGARRIYLGRPWRPYAAVVFLNTNLAAPIEPAGWREWHPGQTDRLATAFYAEYRSFGPGADAAAREPQSHQLTPAQARAYGLERVLGGADHWKP